MTIGAYLRLSEEDSDLFFEGTKVESDSIENQRTLVREYIESEEDLAGSNYLEFVDDGRTGTNMMRPGYQKLLAAVNKGEIDVFIIKDFSRIGRNYIEVGDILDQIFPSLEVRVISILDDFDSALYEGSTPGTAVALKLLMHDLYSKKLSKSVKAVQYAKMEEGEYVNVPPYGYVPSKENKHILAKDEGTWQVVREIFNLVINGKSTPEVARILNQKKIPCPSDYKGWNMNHRVHQGKKRMWTHHRVRDIIENRKYCGDMVYHTRKKMKVTDINETRMPKSQWLLVKDTHEAIVSYEEFKQANEMIVARENYERKAKRRRTIFVCGHCGYAIQVTGVTEKYYACKNGRHQMNSPCNHYRWTKSAMDDVVYESFCKQLEVFLDAFAFEQGENVSKECIMALENDILIRTKAADGKLHRRTELYELYRSGEMTKESFIKEKKLVAAEEEKIRKEISAKEIKVERMKEELQEVSLKKKITVKAIDIQNMDVDVVKEMMYNFVDQIKIFDDHQIKIEWSFGDTYQEMLAMIS